MPRVCHFVRGFLHKTESFIANQIIYHINYSPFLIYCDLAESQYSRKILSEITSLQCINNKYGELLYRHFRALTKSEENRSVEFILKNNIDILHIHFGPDYFLFRNVIRLSGKPSLVSFYGYDSSSFERKYFSMGKIILKEVFNSANYCIAMTPDMKRDLLKLGCPENKIIVHYFGCNTNQFNHIVRLRSKNSKPLTFLTIASLVEKKGHKNIIYAIKHLKDRGKINESQAIFNFVGDGPLNEKLIYLSKKMDVQKYIKFLGPIDYITPRYLEIIENADVFLHPSIVSRNGEKEGIPTSIIEAMASGLPIISTYHAGIPYVIDNSREGLLVQENDIEALAEAIYRLMMEPELRERLGKNGQQKAINELDITIGTKRLEKIYDTLLNESLI